MTALPPVAGGLLFLLLLAVPALLAQGFHLRRRLTRVERSLGLESQRRLACEQELRKCHGYLRDLGLQLLSAQEDERTRLASRIHDDLGQSLTALKLDISWIQNHLPEDLASLRQRLEAVKSDLDRSVEDVRQAAGELHPRILEEEGLSAAVKWQLGTTGRKAGLETVLDARLGDDDSRLLADLALAVFRNFQELLANVVRHAEARKVEVYLAREGDDLVLRVTDDGRGCSQEELSAEGSFGFQQILERARYWGGGMDLRGAPGEGTTVEVTIPFQQA